MEFIIGDPMSLNAKTIQIFLPDGNPEGIKVAQEMESLLVATLIPRKRINDLKDREHIDQYGVYYLIGEGEKGDKAVYVGHSDDCLRRDRQHHLDESKDFWREAIIINSKREDHWNSLHTTYLEAKSIQIIKQNSSDAESYRLINSRDEQTHERFIDESNLSRLQQNFVLIELLLSTLGYPLFTSLAFPKENQTTLFKEGEVNQSDDNLVFYCIAKNADGKGRYSDKGFIVYKDSLANALHVDSFQRYSQSSFKLFQHLIEEGVLKQYKVEGQDFYIFAKNYLFNTPSAASNIVLGRSSNGWIEWKTDKGETLDSIYRSI